MGAVNHSVALSLMLLAIPALSAAVDCDPTDGNSCSDNPYQMISGGHAIPTAFLGALAEKNPPLAGALWGALKEEGQGRGLTGGSSLSPGEYSGTMRFEGRPLKYRTSVREAQNGSFRLAVALWEEGSEEVRERYEGSISADGRKGSLSRIDSRKGKSLEFNW